MRDLTLPHGHARIWLDALPEARYEAERVVRRGYAAKSGTVRQPGVIAVEWFIPAGPRQFYAMLGGTYRPSEEGRLLVDFTTSDGPGSIFDDHIAMPSDPPRLGLPSEYLEAVIAGFERGMQQAGPLPPGRLTLACAAHCAVGSCSWIFEKCAWILCQLMAAGGHSDMSDESLAGLVVQASRRERDD